jgi:haloalkane dehalogenase
VKFTTPATEELLYLRADPLLWEQELDVRPDVAEAIERTTGLRAGQVYWRSAHDHLYSLELLDAGRGRPAMGIVYGHWDRYEPRPPEHEITADLLAFSIWVAEVTPSLNASDVMKVAHFAAVATTWPEGSVLRTPEERFADLPGFPYEPNYVEVEGLRMAYVEHGSGDPILLLHGESTWSYFYRRMIPPLAQAGRVIAPDLIGFGRSDKPVADNAYTYKSHVRWLRGFLQNLDLDRITLVCHGWGGSLGLCVLSQMPERFARLVAMNTGISAASMNRQISDTEAAAYAAPFPSVEYQTAALVLPRLEPRRPDSAAAYDNHVAVERLKALDLPVLLLSSGADPDILRSIFKNAAPPIEIARAGHFIPEDAGEEVAGRILEWMKP